MITTTWEAWAGGLKVQWLPGLETEFKANFRNLVRHSQKFKYMKKRTRGSSVVECLPSMLKALDLVQNDPHSAASSRLYFLSAWLAPFRGTLSVSSDGVFLKQHPEKNGVLILAYRKITTYIFHSPS